MSLSLSEALGYIDRGIDTARQMDVRVALVVVDEFGQLVQLDRMDGGELKGAIGVSGATAQQDEEVAKHAISS